MRYFSKSICTLVALALVCASSLQAATSTWTWTGAGGTTTWSTALNWSGSTSPVNDGSGLVLLGGTTRLGSNVDTPWSIYGLTFSAGAGAYILSGTTLTTGSGGIIDNAIGSTETITAPLVFSAAQTWSIIGGGLMVNAPTIDTAGYPLTVNGSGNVTVYMNGGSNGSGILNSSGLIKNGVGTMTIAGCSPDEFGGATVNGGTLVMNATGAALNGSLTVGGPLASTVQWNQSSQLSGAATAVTVNSTGTLNLNNFSDSFGSLVMTGGTVSTGTGTLTLYGPVTSNAASATATIGGNVNLGWQTADFTVAGAGGAYVDMDLSASISSGGVTKDGTGTLRFSGSAANVYTGDTTVDSGLLLLSKSTAVVSVPADLVINPGGTVRAMASGQMATISNVIIESGTMDLNGYAATIATLTLTGASVTTGSAGQLSLNPATFPSVTSYASATTSVISGNLALGGTAVTFSIDSGGGPIDLDVPATVSNGAIMETGAGLLRLSASNTFTGGVSLDGGTLFIGNNTALGTGTLTIATAASIAADGAARSIANPVFLHDNLLIAGTNDITLSGALTDGGLESSVTISGSFNAIFSGSAVNAYYGGTEVDNAVLQLNRSVPNAAVPGDLIISGSTATVRLLSGNQIADTGYVSLDTGGRLDLNGFSDTVAGISLDGGSSITTGSGTLTIGDDVGSSGSTGKVNTISGNINLGGTNRTFVVYSAGGAIDLDVPAAITNGALIKDGDGVLRLSASNSFAGGSTLLNGTLLVGNNAALGSGTLVMEGGAIASDSAARTLSNVVVLTGSTNIGSNLDITLSGPVSGAGVLNKIGTGALTFSAANTIDGQLQLSAGTLYPGALTMSPFSTYIQNAGTILSGTLLSQGAFLISGGTLTGHFTTQGTGQFSGPYTVGAGMENDGSIAVGFGCTIAINGTGLDNEGSIDSQGGTLGGSGPAVNNGFISGYGTISSTGGFINNAFVSGSGGALTLSSTGGNVNNGIWTMAAGSQLRLSRVGVSLTNSGVLNLNGGILSGPGSLINTSAGTIDGPGIVLVGFTNSGLIQPGGSNAYLSGAQITNDGKIEGAGTVGNPINNAGTVQPLGGTLSLSGSFQNQASGLVIVPSGAELYSGAGLAVNAGIVSLAGGDFDNNGHVLNNTNQITGWGALSTGGLTNNGTLTFTGGNTTVYGAVTNAAGQNIKVVNNSVVFTGNVINSGTFKITGATAAFDLAFTNYGTLLSDSNSQVFNNLTMGSSGSVVGGAAVGALEMTGGSIASTPGTLFLNGNLTTTANASAALISGNLDLGGTNRNLSVACGGGAIDLDIPATVADGGIVKSGSGTLRLSGSNTFAGGVTLSGGTLAIGNNAALGTGNLVLNAGAIQADGTARSVANNVVLSGSAIVTGTANLTLLGSVAGTGSLTKTGTSTLDLKGALSFATLNADGGTTQLDSPLANAAIAVAAGAALNLDTNADSLSIFVSGSAHFFSSQTVSTLTLGPAGTVALAPFTGSSSNKKVLNVNFLIFSGPGGKLDADNAAAVVPASDLNANQPGDGNATVGGPPVNENADSENAVPEPGVLGLLLVGALGLMGRRLRTK